MRSLRIVCYAVNGQGVGHLVRLLAISRWLRRYALFAGLRVEITFLTSSEADGLLLGERFASFKIPSKTMVEAAGLDKLAYLALAKQWVWHSLGLLRPDLLVVDSFPRGSFGELLSALDLARQRAFIYRPVKADIGGRADFQAMLPLYDAILVPEHEADAPVLVPAAAQGKVRHTGPILLGERFEVLPRAEARARLGVPDEALAVYVSAGGGGDPGAEAQLLGAVAALRDAPGVHVVVAPGPLYRGRWVQGPGVTWIPHGGSAAFLAGVDLAVCAAGYNTFGELMFAGVPSIFLPQPKIADEQDRRAERAVAAGAALLAGGDVRAAVEALRPPGARAAAAAAARALVPANHARTAAAELLRLIAPDAAVDAAEAALDDELLATGVDERALYEAALALAPAAEPGLRPPRGTRPAALLDLALGLVRLGAPARVVNALARKLPAGPPAERAAALGAVVDALTPFSDWSGAALFARSLPPDKQRSLRQQGEHLAALLGAARARGEDLYRVAAAVAGEAEAL
jgi:predicted glycosyltransferase